MKTLLWITSLVIVLLSCSRAPLSEKRFTDLLIDLHTAEAILSDARVVPVGEQEKYMYYTGLFNKYGITRAEFDSCVCYYSRQTSRYEKIYESVTDVLNRRDTLLLRAWAELTREDTVNLAKIFRVNTRDTLLREYIRYGYTIIDTLYAIAIRERYTRSDTLPLDEINPGYLVQIDSLRPGRYEMRLRVQFDSTATGTKSRIRPYFTSSAGDTLRVREVPVYGDKHPRDYTWSYYLSDSMRYDRLHVYLFERDTLARKGVQRGKITGIRLYRKYLSPHEAQRILEQQRTWEQRGR
ncbi:MAG: DUF4296 domain-containing protein [Odoribacteraceae bacterium]|jgi:hypothetical protein|nr:DUF4296 domain-containing protein [Odoribacteraceae bacterium]